MRRDRHGHQLPRHRDVYGGPQSPDMKKGYGIAEETVGRWLQRSGTAVQLDTAVTEQLDRIWPGPGEAPKAYAW
jgi:hypothetical protein